MVFLYLISKGCEHMEKSLEKLKQEYEKTTVPVSYTHLDVYKRQTLESIGMTKKQINKLTVLEGLFYAFLIRK